MITGNSICQHTAGFMTSWNQLEQSTPIPTWSYNTIFKNNVPDNNIVGNSFLRPEEKMLRTWQKLVLNRFSVYKEYQNLVLHLYEILPFCVVGCPSLKKVKLLYYIHAILLISVLLSLLYKFKIL